MLKTVDKFLDKITMYRLVLYFLVTLVVAAISLSVIGALQFSAISIIQSTIIVVMACLIINKIFAVIFDAPTNFESTFITALILVLIISPPSSLVPENVVFLLAASGLAMASKYILTVNEKHIFNPAAIAVVLTAIGARQGASWWVGVGALLPFVLIGGLLLVRKIHRERMSFTFFATALVATTFYSILMGINPLASIDNTLLTSAMFFLGFVMLTEPLTTPPTKQKQTIYAILIGIMFPPQFNIFNVHSTPEIALVVGNIYTFLVSPRVKIFPILEKKIRISPDSVDFVFDPNREFAYEPGQYMEWTLNHSGRDSRGDRRYFTLASSPTEDNIRIGVKFYEHGSSYKEAMFQMNEKTLIVADHISGDFTMPKNKKQKLAFIAGGIGVTPFRSMIKYLIDKNEARDIITLYSAKTKDDFTYTKIFEEAREKLKIKTIYAITGHNNIASSDYIHKGRINTKLISEEIPDYSERIFYISGTQSMTESIKLMLKKLGVPTKNIKVDDFSGYS